MSRANGYSVSGDGTKVTGIYDRDPARHSEATLLEQVTTTTPTGRKSGSAGHPIRVSEVFAQLDPAVEVAWQARDGERVRAGQALFTLKGPARSLLTGETVPVFAEPGRVVSAGEVNLTGPLTVRVTAAGRDSSLHRIRGG